MKNSKFRKRIMLVWGVVTLLIFSYAFCVILTSDAYPDAFLQGQTTDCSGRILESAKDLEVRGDHLVTTGTDPWFLISDIEHGSHARVSISLNLHNKDQIFGQFFYSSNGEALDSKKSLSMQLRDGESVLDLTGIDFDLLRIDLGNEAGVELEIPSLEIHSVTGTLKNSIFFIGIGVGLLYGAVSVLLLRFLIRRKEKHLLPGGMTEVQERHPVLLLTGMILITGFLCYWQFLIGLKSYSYFDIGSDTVYQYNPVYLAMSGQIQGGLTNWVSDYGLGTSAVSLWGYYLDPFAWITAFGGLIGGIRGVQIMLCGMQIVKMLLSGLICYRFLQYFSIGKTARILAAYLYAFCGFLILWGQHYFFGTDFVLMSLLFLTLEPALQSEKLTRSHVLLSLSVFFVTVYSYYIAYMVLLMAGVYALVRILSDDREPRRIWKRIGLLMGSVLIGLLSAAVTFLPSAVAIFSVSDRLSQTGLDNIGLYSILVPPERMLSILGRFLSNNLYGDYCWYNYYEDDQLYFSCLMPAFFIAFSLCRENGKEKIRRGILIVILFILPFFTLTGLLNNLFVEPFGRYTLVFMPVYAIIAGMAIEGLLKKKVHLGTFSALSATIYLMIAVILFAFLKDKQMSVLISVLLALLFLLVLYFCYQHSHWKESFFAVLLAGILIWNVLPETYYTVNDRVTLDEVMDLQSLEQARADTKEALSYIGEMDSDYYRIEKNYDDGFLYNEALIGNYRGVSYYNSTTNGFVKEFFREVWPKLICNGNEKKTLFSNDSENAELASLLGVRYLLSKTLMKNEDYRLLKEFDSGIKVYENGKTSSFGRFYSNTVSEEYFLHLLPEDRVELLKTTMVLDHADQKEEGESEIVFKDLGGEDTLSWQVTSSADGYFFLPIPFENGWSAVIDGEQTEILKANIGFSAVILPKGTHTVTFHYDIPYFGTGLLLTCIGLALAFGQSLFLFFKRKRKYEFS